VLLVIAAPTHAADLDTVPVIDCHVHLWDTSRPELTWPRKKHVKLYQPFLPRTHAPICRANGVKGVVVVLSGQALVDNQWNLNVTAHNSRLYRGVVGNLSKAIGTDAFKPLFTKLCQDKRYVGYRLSGRYQERLTDAVMRDLRLTAKMGRTVDFLVGDYSLADVNEIARHISELKIILDHLGDVQLDGGPHDKEWLSGFRTVAKHPNVYCKLSALYGRFKEQQRDGSGETKAGEKLLAMKRIRPTGGVAVSPSATPM
jgi:predicted TIM-barrel fold metal-dependent hydrolase